MCGVAGRSRVACIDNQAHAVVEHAAGLACAVLAASCERAVVQYQKPPVRTGCSGAQPVEQDCCWVGFHWVFGARGVLAAICFVALA